jgi:hypothetical protein
VCLNLQYRTRVIEIVKSKSAIEVGGKRQLLAAIEALKQAVAAGELDNLIDATGAEVSKQFLKVADEIGQKFIKHIKTPSDSAKT